MGMRVIRLPEVLDKTGVGRSTLYEWVREGSFPAPIELGPRTRGWIEEEVDSWIQSRPRGSSDKG